MDPRAAVVDPANVVARTIVSEGCWLWDGVVNSETGYGQFSVRLGGQVRTIQAHRLTYELFVEPVPSWAELDHLCRVRACVRPDHLEAVTHRENVRRGVAGERATAAAALRTHCRRGHAYEDSNVYVHTNASGQSRRYCRTCQRENWRQWYTRQQATTVERVRAILDGVA